ncbi:MAG: leucyl/phenylalanyl-tRNA--protein transferase, partial [Gemmobacter sp.]
PRLTAEHLLRGYRLGIFPMAQSRDDPAIHWVDPQRRGVFPLDGFRITRSLARAIRRADYAVTTDSDFEGVVAACADRPETWINAPIHALYADLHRAGHAHSLEIWAGGALAGGVYGVTIGAAFFGESMFSRRRDASKIALAWLVHRLRAGGFTLFDTQFLTPHLASLGAVEIGRAEYHRRLEAALAHQADWNPPGYAPDPQSIAQRSSQTS